jgi:hypothetical protein
MEHECIGEEERKGNCRRKKEPPRKFTVKGL